MIVNANNIHEEIIKFVEDKELSITTYDDIKNVYCDMISSHYYFVLERDLIADILVDITYMLSSNSINRGRVIGTIDMEDDDDYLSD